MHVKTDYFICEVINFLFSRVLVAVNVVGIEKIAYSREFCLICNIVNATLLMACENVEVCKYIKPR